MEIKQHSKVTNLGCILNETMSGESMYLKVINKTNSRLKFLHRKNNFLTPALRRLLCNALIQPNFDYASSAWYPNLTRKMKNKIHCLLIDKMTHISKNESETLNWLPVKNRFNQSIYSIVFKYFTKQCPCLSNCNWTRTHNHLVC